MSFQLTHRIERDSKNEYATNEDFRRLFTEHVNGLYLLSFLLTANHEKAEQCFVTGLDECVTGDPVFREWACTWARRVIVRNAICVIGPHISPARTPLVAFHSASEGHPSTTSLQDAPFAGVLALGNFERFVYVLSVLEKYSDQDCATLLGASRQDVHDGRARAFQLIAASSRGTVTLADDLCDAVMT